MKLTILKPYESQIIDISWIEVNTSVGNFVLQRGHAPMILALAENEPITYCLKSGKQETEILPGGLLEINREEATIIVSN